jgi:hypothetical protein
MKLSNFTSPSFWHFRNTIILCSPMFVGQEKILEVSGISRKETEILAALSAEHTCVANNSQKCQTNNMSLKLLYKICITPH